MGSSDQGNIDARVVGNALIVSFLSAGEAKVWRADMSQLLTASLEVKERQGKFALLLKSGLGVEEEIVSFADKKRALDALQSIAGAMLSGGHDRAAPRKSGWLKKLLKMILTLLGIFVLLIVLWTAYSPINPHDAAVNSRGVRTGVPIPADELLGK